MTTKPLYLDYHATTPVDPRVLAEMLPYFTEQFGNPASRQHAWGWEANGAVDTARERVAALINASPGEILFTSGASESNNLAIKGVADCLRERGNRIVTIATEHKSVLDTCGKLGRSGFELTVVGVGTDGLIDLDELRRAMQPGTILVSVMAANNEIGTLQPLAAIGAIAHEHGALLHTDAAQGAGKIPIDVQAMQIDLLSLTGHKFYGPKGAGALFVRKMKPKLALTAQIDGGGQESGMRSGTLNVPGIVGVGRAAEICRLEMPEESARLSALRNRLLSALTSQLDGVRVNGTLERRLPHNLHVSFDDVEGEALLMALGDLAVSTGSACSSGSQKPSHVLQAIGAIGDRAGASIRFGLGRMTTQADVDRAASRVVTVVGALRARNPAVSKHEQPRMKITVAHSPDSDDAFMFYGLASGSVETGGVEVDQVLADIETLNRAAFDGKYEVTAVSFHAFAHLVDRYALLPHGASMGDRYGPIVVSRQDGPSEVKGRKIAIPGTLTTAYLTLRLYEPSFEYVVVPFDQIQQAVLDGQADAGLLIHEGQLTYAEEGLKKIVDLGEWWADRTGGLPLPLGGNIIRRDLGQEMIRKVSKMLHDSIAYALSHRREAVEYAQQFGRGLDKDRTDTFVGMYVNDLTLGYGDRGRQGVERLLTEAFDKGLIPKRVPIEFAA